MKQIKGPYNLLNNTDITKNPKLDNTTSTHNTVLLTGQATWDTDGNKPYILVCFMPLHLPIRVSLSKACSQQYRKHIEVESRKAKV